MYLAYVLQEPYTSSFKTLTHLRLALCYRKLKHEHWWNHFATVWSCRTTVVKSDELCTMVVSANNREFCLYYWIVLETFLFHMLKSEQWSVFCIAKLVLELAWQIHLPLSVGSSVEQGKIISRLHQMIFDIFNGWSRQNRVDDDDAAQTQPGRPVKS